LHRQVDTIKKRYLKLIGTSIHEYISSVFSEYCKQPSTTPISNALDPIQSLCDDVDHLQDIILQEDGVSLTWNHAEDLCKQLRAARCMLEDFFCYALLGFEDVIEAHNKGLMAYQIDS